jgi:acyl-CoA thioesterase I
MRRVTPCLPVALAPGAVLAALMACGGGTVTRPDEIGGAPAGGPVPIVVALGDSLTAGPGLRPEDTYPSRLQERVDARGYPHRIVNAGVSGDTTAGALRRLDAALVPGTRVLIVALGANDGLRGVPVGEVRSNLSRIVERAQARSIHVLLCGMETPPTRGWQYTLDFHRVFPDLAARYTVPLMPFLLAGVVGDRDHNLEDGLHPNAAGARRIADNMWPYLEPLLVATRVSGSAGR